MKLQVWTDKFPVLGQAYELKEQFFDIYEAKSIKEAYKLYQNWLSNVPKELMTYFEDLIKSMNQYLCGYSFEALKAKILFTQGYRKGKMKKKFKEVEATFGKLLPDQFQNWGQIGYE